MPPDYRDFDRTPLLLTRVEGILVNETPLRIGTSRETAPIGASTDLAVYRVNGLPCIPGSSLKGVLRSHFELLAKSKGFKIHDPWNSEAAKLEAENRDFCIVCGTFGSTELASHVTVYDAYPLSDVRTFHKTSVSIDREFRGARPDALFKEELVPPRTEWSFKMDIVNIEVFPNPKEGDARAELLRTTIENLFDPGLQVGARRTLGYGLIKLSKLNWKVYVTESGELKVKSEGVLP